MKNIERLDPFKKITANLHIRADLRTGNNLTAQRAEEGTLYRHRLQQFIEEFLDSGDPRPWNLTANSLLPMLKALNMVLWEAEERLEG